MAVRFVAFISLSETGWFDRFRFIECDFDDLDKYERRWIRKFKPKENRYKYLKQAVV